MNNDAVSYKIKQNPGHFQENDPHLSALKKLRYVNLSKELLTSLPCTPGLYLLIGGCLTGKTTLLKQWVVRLLAEQGSVPAIWFVEGHTILNRQPLFEQLTAELSKQEKIHYLLIDDIEAIPNFRELLNQIETSCWIKHTIVLATSTLSNLRETLHQYKNMCFSINLLSFREVVLLKNGPADVINPSNLFDEFDQYLIHGGYLPAINDMAMHGKILASTLKQYSDRLRKEMISCGKQDQFTNEILKAIIDHYCMPVTWNELSHDLSINHPHTVASYIAQLEILNVLFVQYPLKADGVSIAPKKARKLMFTDPFLFHALKAWIQGVSEEAFITQIVPFLQNTELSNQLVAGSVIANYKRIYPTYYIKEESEIDLTYFCKEKFIPILILWTHKPRIKSLKRMLTFPNGKILTRQPRSDMMEHIRTEPLPQALWKLKEYKS